MAKPEHKPLSALVTLPARDLHSILAACEPLRELDGKDLDAVREDLSAVRGGGRIRRMEKAIRYAAVGQYQAHLLSGHVGSGKSTELHWLGRELQQNKEGRRFHVVHLDVRDYLDARDVQLPELLTALFAAIVDDPELHGSVHGFATARRFWGDILNSYFKTGISLDRDIAIGVHALTLELKTSSGFRNSYRDLVDDAVSTMLADLGSVLADVRAHFLPQGADDLVIVIDNMERSERRPLADGTRRTTQDRFFLEQLPLLRALPAHLVLTLPFSLEFTEGRLRNAFVTTNCVTLPMVAVHLRAEPNKPDQAGIAALRRLLGRRVDLATVFADEDAVTHAIEQSGGCIPDLFRIVAQSALVKDELKLTVADVDKTVSEFVGDVEKILQGKPFLAQLAYVAAEGAFPGGVDDDTRQWLLDERVVLEYGAKSWYGVHPFAQRAMATLEGARGLLEATVSSDVVIAGRVKNILQVADRQANELFKLLPFLGEDDIRTVQTVIDRLTGVLAAKQRPPRILGKGLERLPFNTHVRQHFSALRLDRWRGFSNVEFGDLRRVNVIGGVNNAGKTSVLEAIYVLSQQADAEALFEVVARRGKVARDVDPKWFLDQVPEHARIEGTFDTLRENATWVTVDVDRSGKGIEDKAFYLGTVAMASAYGGHTQSSRAHVFSERHDLQVEAHGDKALCRAILSSPFSMHDPEVLVRIHKRSVETKSKERILTFLRDSIDSGILAVDLVDELKRFLVSHRDFERSPDLTQFGEGLQRIFHMALLFAYAEHGIVLIDELDNAVHVGLLRPVTRLLHELAKRFNTQVFVTTHSKECIEAWVDAAELAADVTYFGIGIHEGARFVRSLPGEDLAELVELGGVDPRWVR